MSQFKTKTMKLVFGEGPRKDCQLCWKKRTRFGMLVDPNGHLWLICAECINTLWAGNQAIITEDEIDQRARQLIQERLMGND